MTLTKEEKEALKRIANSKDGELLCQIFKKLIDDLKDISTLPDQNFEMEGRIRKGVIKELARILNTLRLLKLTKEEQKIINEYV